MALPADWEETTGQSGSVSQLQKAGGQRRVRIPPAPETAECQEQKKMTERQPCYTTPRGGNMYRVYRGTKAMPRGPLSQEYLRCPCTCPLQKLLSLGSHILIHKSIKQISKLRPKGAIYFLNSTRHLAPFSRLRALTEDV